jgi:acetolactate decarboxylase
MGNFSAQAADFRPTEDHRPAKLANRLYQTSTMAALLDAVYDGDTTMAKLLEHGDFGIGTFDALDGELILLDGVVRQFREDGLADEVAPDIKTPFACATFFEPEQTLRIAQPASKQELELLVDRMVGNDNLFAAVRATGLFEDMETRTVFRQSVPYPPMLDVVSRQPTLKLGNTGGVLIGFRTPEYMQGINVAGYHLHFLTTDRRRGGHVLNYRLLEGTLEVAVMSDLEIDLPRSKAFARANLCPADLNEAILVAEGR